MGRPERIAQFIQRYVRVLGHQLDQEAMMRRQFAFALLAPAPRWGKALAPCDLLATLSPAKSSAAEQPRAR
jgi:protein involved in temperature-dependent protein secretion